MNEQIAKEIQDQQEHGRQKYGNGPNDLAHNDQHTDYEWHSMIDDHNTRTESATPMERRRHLIKVAGLAVSAIEAFDRKGNRPWN